MTKREAKIYALKLIGSAALQLTENMPPYSYKEDKTDADMLEIEKIVYAVDRMCLKLLARAEKLENNNPLYK